MKHNWRWHLILASFLLVLTSCGYANPNAMQKNPYGYDWHCVSTGKAWDCHAVNMPGEKLYEAGVSANAKRQALIKALGWISDSRSKTNNCALCGGHYYFPKTPPGTKALADSPTKLQSGNPEYQVGGLLKLENGVVVTQAGRRLYAQNAIIKPNPKTGKLDTISAHGNIRLRQPGLLILGSKLHANLISHHATLNSVHYLARLDDGAQGKPLFQLQRTISGGTAMQDVNQNFTGFAHGKAKEVIQLSQNKYLLKHATYSTCPPDHKSWELHASKITLDNKKGVGEAKNVWLKFYHVPIFYAPDFSFPLNDKRKTGVLSPEPNYSSNYGFYLGLPIYLNLAPNYDDTITPQYYTKHGLLIANKFRLLTKHNYLSARVQVVPYDRITHKFRYAAFINDRANLPLGFNLTGTYNQVGDRNYLRDFSNQDFGDVTGTSTATTPLADTSAAIANTAIVPRRLELSRPGKHWDFNAIVDSYKVIGALSTVNKPYSQLPSISLDGSYPTLLHPLALSIKSNYTNFQKTGLITAGNALSNDGKAVTGQRAYVEPSISLPFQSIYGFLVPKISLNAASYYLKHVQDTNINRVLPIFDVDAGLYLKRQFHFLNAGYSQVLEPKVFYLFVPYAKQNNIPIFDTSLNTFSFSQLFATNRFSGEDRISNANQLSLGASTQVYNATGREILSANIGQAIYFQNRKVSLCHNVGGSNCIAAEQPDYDSRLSDLVFNLTYYLNQAWTLGSAVNYSTKRSVLDYEQYHLQYSPNPKHIFNLQYNSNLLDYGLLSTQQILSGTPPPSVSQLTASLLWGLSLNWHIVGGVNYSLNNKRVFSDFTGLEYDACCWRVSLMVNRYLSAINPNTPNVLNGPRTTAVMLQFELKGLGGEEMNGGRLSALLHTIPGYSSTESEFN